MDNRQFESGASASPPSPPASPSAGYPTNGNPGTGTPATVPGEWWFHQTGEELRGVIAAAGLTPDHGDLGQLLEAIRILTGRSALVVMAGSQSIPNGVATAVSFGTEEYDDAGLWSAGSPTRLVVPVGYSYARLAGGLTFPQSSGGERILQVLKNGGVFNGSPSMQLGPSPSTAYDAMNIQSGWLPVSGGDYFELSFVQTTGSSMSIGGDATQRQGSWFFMEVKR